MIQITFRLWGNRFWIDQQRKSFVDYSNPQKQEAQANHFKSCLKLWKTTFGIFWG